MGCVGFNKACEESVTDGNENVYCSRHPSCELHPNHSGRCVRACGACAGVRWVEPDGNENSAASVPCLRCNETGREVIEVDASPSVPQPDRCPTCDGYGYVYPGLNERECHVCHGSGFASRIRVLAASIAHNYLEYIGPADRQRLAEDIASALAAAREAALREASPVESPTDDADERGPVAVVERRSRRADDSWGKWSMRHVFDTEQQARQFILGHKWSPEEQARVATYVRIPAPPTPPTKGTP